MPDKKAAPPVTITIPRFGLPAPEGTNFFHFTFSGPEVEMLAGFMDLNRILDAQRKAKAGESSIAMKPEITHRFLLSVRGFILLKQQVDDIARKLEKANPGIVSESPFQTGVG